MSSCFKNTIYSIKVKTSNGKWKRISSTIVLLFLLLKITYCSYLFQVSCSLPESNRLLVSKSKIVYKRFVELKTLLVINTEPNNSTPRLTSYQEFWIKRLNVVWGCVTQTISGILTNPDILMIPLPTPVIKDFLGKYSYNVWIWPIHNCLMFWRSY